MSRIFISHSSEDREQSARLLAWLHSHGFVSTFLDFDKQHGIRSGADWERTLYRELSSADAVLLVLTRNWFASRWCFAEFAQARALGKAIFPLIESPTGETFVSSDIQHLDLIKDREGGLQHLLSDLTRIALDTRGGFPWDATRPPYPGLLAFDEADAAIYFGRDDDIRRLIERLNARRAQGGEKLVLVLGASGSGKSSLLRAGVVPRLKRDPHNWIVLPPFRPQLHPLDELAQVVAAGLGQATDWRRWRDEFSAGDLTHSLSDLARDLRAAHNETEAQILLVIDQGEELFAAADPAQTEPFFRALNSLLDERLPFLAVMSLRSDYLGRLQQEPRLQAPFEQFSLKPMPLERVRAIIEGPAKVAGVAVDDGLVTAAVTDAQTEDALPLLAFALRELYDRFASSGRLTAESYRALGDPQAQLSPLENAVRRKADEVLAAARPAPEDLDALKEAFIPAMVRVNPEGEYVRRPAPVDSIPSRALSLIERLAKARLLTILEELGVRTVEVAHEALLRKWPLLKEWLDEEREFLVGKAQLEQDLLDWERAAPEQKHDALLTGLKLTRARTWLVAKPQQLTTQECTFIQASIARHEADAAQRERARRRVLRGAIAAAAVMTLIAIAALWEWRQAKIEESSAVSRQLAAQSIEDSAADLGAALRDAVAACERLHTGEAEAALNTALANPQERYILHHKAKIHSAVFSPDGSRIVTASDDLTARVWDAENGHLLATLTGHAGGINSAAFSPDGVHIVTAGSDNQARVWDTNDGHLVVTLNGHAGGINSAVFSPDGKRIVTASDDHFAAVWDAASGYLLFVLIGHNKEVNSAVFSPGPNALRIVTASSDGTARMWDGENGHLLVKLTVPSTDHDHVTWGVNSAVFSPDGSRIVTASEDGTARVWNASDGRLLVTLITLGVARTATFSPDGNRIAAASGDEARVWNAEDGRLLATLTGHSSLVSSAVFSPDPDGSRIVTAGDDNTARMWDARSGRLLATLAGHIKQVNSAAFSPDGKRIVTASDDGTARVWDPRDSHLMASLGPAYEVDLFASNMVNSVAFSPNGSRIVAASDDDTASVWNAGDGRLIATLSGHTDKVVSAVFSPDGSRIVTASDDKTARIWDAGDGRLLATLIGHADKVKSAVFSPDGTRIVTASDDNTARIWNAANGQPLAKLPGPDDSVSVNCAAFSPDGRLVVTGNNDGTAQVWGTGDGRLLVTFKGHFEGINSAAFSLDGKLIVTASEDGTAREWDARNGHPMAALSEYSAVHSAAFSPDGRRIVTASEDHLARVWDTRTGRLLATLKGHAKEVGSAVFSSDGSHVLTSSWDGTARMWDAVDGHLVLTLPSVSNVAFSPDGSRIAAGSTNKRMIIYMVGLNQLLRQAEQLLPVDSGN